MSSTDIDGIIFTENVTDLQTPCYESPEIPRWTVPLPHRVLGLLIGGCFLLFGLTGNILLVTSYIKNKHVQTPFNTIVLSMSCNDLVWITCIFTVLLSVYGRGEWLPIYTTSGDVDVLCAYMNIVHTQCEILSFLHVIVVGLYRYAVVVHPIGKLGRISQSRVWVSLMIFIVYAFVVCVWSVQRVRAFTAPDRSSGTGLRFTPVFDTRVMFCYTPCIRVITLLMTVLGLCLPCGLSIMYVRILMVARRSRRIRATNTNQTSTSQKKEIRFIFLVSLLLLTCLICYCGLLFVFKIDINESFSHSVYLPFVFLSWVPPSCNWLIYTGMATDFKEVYKRVIFRQVLRTVTTQSVSTVTWTSRWLKRPKLCTFDLYEFMMKCYIMWQ